MLIEALKKFKGHRSLGCLQNDGYGNPEVGFHFRIEDAPNLDGNPVVIGDPNDVLWEQILKCEDS